MKNIFLFIVLLCITNLQDLKAAFIIKHFETKITLPKDQVVSLGQRIAAFSNGALYYKPGNQIIGPRLNKRGSGSRRGGDKGGSRHKKS
jgi:hypothetical protein